MLSRALIILLRSYPYRSPAVPLRNLLNDEVPEHTQAPSGRLNAMRSSFIEAIYVHEYDGLKEGPSIRKGGHSDEDK